MAKLHMKSEFMALIGGALGFVAALVWKDAIMAWLAPIMEGASGPTALTIVALIVTGIAIFVIYLMKRFLHR